jgi:tetrahydromethanopterin S-methyltransferase subunit H
MVVYEAAADYIRTGTNLKTKIDKIEAVITALENSLLTVAEKDGIEEYLLDDGQTKIKTVYRTSEQVMKSIMAMEKLRSYYINKKVGRQVRLVDEKNFREAWGDYKGS